MCFFVLPLSGYVRFKCIGHRLQTDGCYYGKPADEQFNWSFQMTNSPRKTFSINHISRYIYATIFLILFAFANVASSPAPAHGQNAPDPAAVNTYLPFMLVPPPAVYDPKRAAHVTDLVDLAPFETERWGRGSIFEIAYSPADDQLAVATSVGVWIYRLDEPDNGRLLAHRYWVWSVSWSPDGSQIASGSDDSTVRIWDVASGKKVNSLWGEDEGRVESVSWSPDGSQVAFGLDGAVRIWDVASGERVNSLWGHTSGVNSVSWSPGGSQVASATHRVSIA